MRKFLLLLLFISIVDNYCNAISAIDILDKETLIAFTYKEIKNGNISFSVFIGDDKVKKISYTYSIDVKNKKVTCRKWDEKIYNIYDDNDYLNSIQHETADTFKRSQINSWREKYYRCFKDDFLDLSNDDKILLLNQIVK